MKLKPACIKAIGEVNLHTIKVHAMRIFHDHRYACYLKVFIISFYLVKT